MSKRIIVEMDVDYWNADMRKELMRYLIHNLKVCDAENNDRSDFQGAIIEPMKPYPLIHISKDDGDLEFEIKWD